ncbi:50S ribosomal protein L11 methyltransferase [Mesorhizobium sp. LHD-90]|uniref:class I SAM-dependent methyltransferase n=1 Tax=Mesorhizobium sp. LHD-90 TaxID=3071414 RepID=UPI0027DEC8B6|nr:50S ribosomal protein L11 methyltransferase [Mesorhizobium sp. LHD-90]MDQ6434797.1 50S ribosomal protein L11 methyltransferase [Mesorhizobium sp. LHD-90]
MQFDSSQFIRDNMRVAPVPSVPEIRLYTATPASGLRRLAEKGGKQRPPYWAYQWAGGLALARYILDHPETVAGRRVLDLGAGSGLVGIAAAKAGASAIVAAESDRYAHAAIRLNASENGIAIDRAEGDVLAGPPPAVDLVLAGDVFYCKDVAARMLVFLDRCLAARIAVLVGDPGRPPLPRARLRAIADYMVTDVGDGGARTPAWVYVLEPPADRGDAPTV